MHAAFVISSASHTGERFFRSTNNHERKLPMGGFSKVPVPPSQAGGNGDADLPSGADFSAPEKATSFKPVSTTAASRRSSFLNNLTGNDFGLSAPVGPVGSGAANRPGDVFKVETVLDGAGLLGRQPGRSFGSDTAKAITSGQQAFNSTHARRLGKSTLKEDGLINPNGPTHSATRDLAGNLLSDDQGVGNALKMQQRDEALAARTKAAQTKTAVQRREMVKRAAAKLKPQPRNLLTMTPRPAAPKPMPPVRPAAQRTPPVQTAQSAQPTVPNPGQPWWKQGGLKPLDAAGDASNQRTADHLRTIHGVGDMPRWTADALETSGDKGIADVADLLEKVHQNNPAQARLLADETYERLSPETQKRLREMELVPVELNRAGSVDTKNTEALGISVKKDEGSKRKFETPPRKPLPPGKTKDNGQFQSPIHSKFRHAIHKRESDKDNYYAIGKTESGKNVAWGRYQFTEIAFKAAGLKDEKGNWTGKYGVRNLDDFMKNGQAQERGMTDYMRDNWRQMQQSGALNHIGQRINGRVDKFQVSDSGLYAAAHRYGAPTVREYLSVQRTNGWNSGKYAEHPKEKAFLAIEKRLREFEKIPVRDKP
jgi:hypothetical protein